jgi:hypothetical protein
MAWSSFASRPRSAKVSALAATFAIGVSASGMGNGSSFVSSLRFILKGVATAVEFVGGYGYGEQRLPNANTKEFFLEKLLSFIFFLILSAGSVQKWWWGSEEKEDMGGIKSLGLGHTPLRPLAVPPSSLGNELNKSSRCRVFVFIRLETDL